MEGMPGGRACSTRVACLQQWAHDAHCASNDPDITMRWSDTAIWTV
jgi:hypothetical protein